MFRNTSIFLIRIYQLILSPDQSVLFSKKMRTCRFFPSCSVYTIGVLQTHGFLRGWWYGMKRMARCHPWQEGGYDPPPMAEFPCSSGRPSQLRGRRAISKY